MRAVSSCQPRRPFAKCRTPSTERCLHGLSRSQQGSGKIKIEKRLKKQIEQVNDVSLLCPDIQEHVKQAAEQDTSGTLLLMRQRQTETGTAHVILSSSQFLAYVELLTPPSRHRCNPVDCDMQGSRGREQRKEAFQSSTEKEAEVNISHVHIVWGKRNRKILVGKRDTNEPHPESLISHDTSSVRTSTGTLAGARPSHGTILQ